MRNAKTLAMALATLCAPQLTHAQPVPGPTFEVASIKPAKPGAKQIFEVTPAGNLTWQISLGDAIRRAYKVKPPFELYGAPGWVDTEEYLIVAKSPDGSPLINPKNLPAETEFLQRVQSLLTDRFHLVVHHENRDTPVYTLVVAKNGPKLKAADPTQPFRLRRAGKGNIVNEGPAKIGLLVSLLASDWIAPCSMKPD